MEDRTRIGARRRIPDPPRNIRSRLLHHTGALWAALDHIDQNVTTGGKLCIALYNRQPVASQYWLAIKKKYNRFPAIRPFLIGIHLIYPFLPSVVLRRLQARKLKRGMSPWRDLIDWLGGYPFEVSRPEEIFNFYRHRDYALMNLKTVAGRMGCNEYVFEKAPTAPQTPSQ